MIDGLLIFIILLLLSLLLGGLMAYRRLRRAIGQTATREDSKQLEALISLVAVLKPTCPLPPLRGWVCSPDLLNLLAETILSIRPKYVVEAGSGISTLVIASCLQQLGRGQVVSLDHDAAFAEQTRALLARHGLTARATVLHASLTTYDIHGQIWQWYTLAEVPLNQPIDLLLVDGPPHYVQALARYPALPLLETYLSEHAVVLLDDAARSDEREMVQRWVAEYPGWSCSIYETETGAVRLQRHGII